MGAAGATAGAAAGAGVRFTVLVLAGPIADGVLVAVMGVSGGGVLLVAGTDGAPGVMGGAMIGAVCGVTGGAMTGLLTIVEGDVRGGVSVLTATVLAGLLVTATGVTAGVLAGTLLTGLGWLGGGMSAVLLMLERAGGVSNSLMPGLMGEKTTLKTLPVCMLTKRSSMRLMVTSIGSAAVVEELAVADVLDTGSLSSAPWNGVVMRGRSSRAASFPGDLFPAARATDCGWMGRSCFVGPAGIQSD